MGRIILAVGDRVTYWTLPPSVAKEILSVLKKRLGAGTNISNPYYSLDEQGNVTPTPQVTDE